MIRKHLPGVMILLVLGMLLAGMMFKDSLTNSLTKAITSQRSTGEITPEMAFIDSAFNYTKNNRNYQLTFLEFGATSCSGCKKMEKVMQIVKDKYPEKINVVFYNVNLKENSKMANHFGIRMIPVQVLLNESGKEYFRHVGYLSFNELTKEFKNHFSSK